MECIMAYYIKDASRVVGFQSRKAGPTLRVLDGARVGPKGRVDQVSDKPLKGANKALRMLDSIAHTETGMVHGYRHRKHGERF